MERWSNVAEAHRLRRVLPAGAHLLKSSRRGEAYVEGVRLRLERPRAGRCELRLYHSGAEASRLGRLEVFFDVAEGHRGLLGELARWAESRGTPLTVAYHALAPAGETGEWSRASAIELHYGAAGVDQVHLWLSAAEAPALRWTNFTLLVRSLSKRAPSLCPGARWAVELAHHPYHCRGPVARHPAARLRDDLLPSARAIVLREVEEGEGVWREWLLVNGHAELVCGPWPRHACGLRRPRASTLPLRSAQGHP